MIAGPPVIPRWCVACLALLVCVGVTVAQGPPAPDAPTRGYDPAYAQGVGDDARFWLLVRSVEDRDRPYTLFHAPTTLEPGSLRLASNLAESPVAIATTGDGLACVFPARRTSAEGASDAPRVALHPVRHFRVRTLPTGVETVEAPTALPPLELSGTLVSLAHQAGALHALVRNDDGHGLLRLEKGAWVGAPLPEHLASSPESDIRLMRDPTRVSVLERVGNACALHRSSDEGWDEERFMLPDAGDRLLTLMGRRVAIGRSPSGTGEIVRSVGAGDLDLLVEPVPENAVVAAYRNAIAFAWPAGDGTVNVRLRAIDLEGNDLYDDHADMRGPVSASDIQTLALAMLGLCVLVTVFVVRTGEEREPFLPDAYALASPLRRTGAWLLDLAPGLAACAIIWPELIGQPQAMFESGGPGGPWPLALIITQLIVLSTIGETTLGVTLGKAALGLRTITYDGERPSPWMAFSRNVVRGLCPPVAVFSVMNPGMPSPASFQTLVVVRRKDV